MNDLELLREIGDETPVAGPAELAAARGRLLAMLSREPAAARGRRFVIGGVTVAAAAAVAVGALVMAPGGATSPGRPAAVHLTAMQVLDRAAAAALGEPTVIPRPDQFIYTKSTAANGELVTEYWHSVDGLRDSLITTTSTFTGRTQHSSEVYPGCVDGHYNVVSNPGLTGSSCTVWPGYLSDLPTSASEMLTYLEQTQGVEPGNPATLFHAVGEGLSEEYLLPAQRAALYELIATAPGLTVVPGVADMAGRTGLGVQDGDGNLVLIFDPQNFTFLGWNIEGDHATGGAVLQVAIVDQAGQLP